MNKIYVMKYMKLSVWAKEMCVSYRTALQAVLPIAVPQSGTAYSSSAKRYV